MSEEETEMLAMQKKATPIVTSTRMNVVCVSLSNGMHSDCAIRLRK